MVVVVSSPGVGGRCRPVVVSSPVDAVVAATGVGRRVVVVVCPGVTRLVSVVPVVSSWTPGVSRRVGDVVVFSSWRGGVTRRVVVVDAAGVIRICLVVVVSSWLTGGTVLVLGVLRNRRVVALVDFGGVLRKPTNDRRTA